MKPMQPGHAAPVPYGNADGGVFSRERGTGVTVLLSVHDELHAKGTPTIPHAA